jgi:cytochrome oxidase Cu insertion factor (SCO1/SenC/PrrC family)
VRAPGFTLENQLARRVSLSAFRGRVVVLAFLSTDCRACVLAAQQVRGALDELAGAPTYGRGTAVGAMQVLFVSTDPRVDTSANVKRLLAETSLTGRVEYLTGTPKELGPVWRAYRIPPPSTGRAASEAATTVLLIGRSGDERVVFGLEQLTPESLSHDIRLLRDGRSQAHSNAPSPAA